MMLTPKDIEFLRGDVGTHQTPLDKVNLGDILVKPGVNIEGLSFGNTMFRVFGRVDSINGIDINSFILKEVAINDNGEFVDADSKRQKMTINRHVCNTLGIEFQQGLELWPIESNFIRYEDFINKDKHNDVIDYSNMGTYPCDKSTGLIKKVCVELTGFRVDNDILLTPKGGRVTIENFLATLRFTNGNALFPIKPEEIQHIPINASENEDFIHQIRTKGSMCFELNFDTFCKTGKCGGVNPKSLNGLDIDDIIDCSWVEQHEVNVEYEQIALKRNVPSAISNRQREEEIFAKLNRSMAIFEREMNDFDLHLESIFNKLD